MELKIRVEEHILVILEDIRGRFSSMEKNANKKINLQCFTFTG